MLQITGLEKAFAGRAVLRGVELRAGSSESVALVGANGSGKTTTLRAIVGLALPERGRILVDGIDAIRHPREARRRMSYMPQSATYPETLTVRETFEVVARLRGLARGRVDEELAACGLVEAADSRVAALSGGQRQRVALGTALLPDVGLYLFDEPTANLDLGSVAMLGRRIARLRAEGRAVVFTTHVADDVRTLGTRVERIENGRCPDTAVAEGCVDVTSPARRSGGVRTGAGWLWERLARS